MKRKVSFIILCMFVILFLNGEIHSFAQANNVKDCLETNEDCLEELDQPASEVEADETTGNTQSTSFIFNFIKMIVALLLVLALIYLLLTFIKKRNKLTQQVKVLENLGGISVGQNKSIQLVRIGEKIYLIGVGDNVDMLQEITDKTVKHELLYQEEQTAETRSFLQRILNRNESAAESKEVPFTNTLQNELNKLKSNREDLIHTFKKKDDEHD